MAFLIGNSIDLNRTELQNAVVQNLSSAPSTPPEGLIYYDTTLDKFGCYHAGGWVYLATAGTGTVTTVSVVSANGFAGSVATATTTPAITLTTSVTGMLKGLTGALTAATSGVDYSAGTSALATGILKSTTSTGTLTIAVAGDFPTLNQSTTGSAATLTTSRNIYGNAFNGSADVTGIIAGTYGGTGVNNASKTITLGGNLTTAGAFNTTLTVTATTSVTLPTTGTLATLAGTETFTNKTIDANGTGNSITNLETADFATNVIDTDGTLAANSNTRLATQAAVKTYVDGKVVGLLDYKGAIDASANPNFPSASKGDYYKISVAGKIGGASGTDVSIGDAIIANADNVGGTLASVGTSWDVINSNVEQATTTTIGLVELATVAEAEAKTDTVRAVTPASLTSFGIKKSFTIGDGSTTAIVVTHNLGTQDITWSIRNASTNAFVLTDVTATSTNTATFTFAVAPATNAYRVVIIG